jgi:hypothetical protein
MIAAAPLVPAAAEITAKALAAVPKKPSGEIILPAGSKIDIRLTSSSNFDFIPANFTIPPQPPFPNAVAWGTEHIRFQQSAIMNAPRFTIRPPLHFGPLSGYGDVPTNAKPISLSFPPEAK